MADEKAIEMYVGGLVLDPNTQAPIVVLKDESGQVCLPIWIGIAEATAIATVLKNLNLVRPMTHDLMFKAFGEAGLTVQRVIITDLKDSTYFSELVLKHGDKVIILDARPSDAIALALRASASVFVAEHVIEQAKISFVPELYEDASQATGSGEEGGNVDEESAEKSFTNVDKDKWAEILAELDPDDFKYKM